MSWVAVATIGGSIIGGVISSEGAQNAADTQAQSARDSSGVQQAMFNKTQENLSPWLNTGKMALSNVSSLAGVNPDGSYDPNAQLVRPFGMQDLQNDPGYQAMLKQGNEAIYNKRSGMGGVNSGATLRDLATWAQGPAFEGAYNRYNANLGNIWNRLSGLSGGGQNAAAMLGGFSGQTGGQIGNNIIGAGNAQAAGQVGSANALTGGISSAYNNWLMGNILQNQGGGGGGGGTASASMPWLNQDAGISPFSNIG